MSMYKHIRNMWKKPKKSMPDLWRERLLKWRQEPSTIRIERPTRIDKARSLGYKAKQGFIVVRQRVPRGGHFRGSYLGGRRSKHQRKVMILGKSYQQVAEERANRKYPNCEVLNSYWVAKNGICAWYEVILIDKAHPAIKTDSVNWITAKQHKRRVYRGLTSAARKSRGLRNKGKGAEKVRPSLRAKGRKGTN